MLFVARLRLDGANVSLQVEECKTLTHHIFQVNVTKESMDDLYGGMAAGIYSLRNSPTSKWQPFGMIKTL